MSEQNLQKARWILGGVSVTAFALILVLSVVKAPEALFPPLIGLCLIAGILAFLIWLFTQKGGSKGTVRTPIPEALKRKMFARAGDRCQFQECPETGRSNLELHHIDMNPSSNSESNLIALCPTHHHKAHTEQDITDTKLKAWAHGQYDPSKGPA